MTDELDTTVEGGDGTEVSLTSLLEDALILAVQAMQGQAIGKVETYNSAADTVSITPVVPLLVAGEMIPAPKIPDVPVAWPQLGSMSLKFPVAAGSFMRLSVLGHDHSGWIVSGTEGVQPVDDRRFSLSDLVAVASAPSPLSSPPDPTSYDAAWAVLFGSLKVGDSTATEFVAWASKVVTELQNIRTFFDAHTHPTAAPGPVSVPTLLFATAPAPGPIGNIAASKLKAL